MRTVVTLVAAALAAALLAAPAHAHRGPRPVPPFTVTRLPNGLRVITVPAAAPGLVAYYTLVRVGSRNEVEPGHSGFAHLFEHMMFRGTEKWPEGKWTAAMKKHGVDATAFTSDDMTVYTMVGPSAALPIIIETEADRFQHLAYSKEVFQTETKAVLGEYHKNFANPVNKMEEVLYDRAFERHTYKHTTMGFLADIKAMPGYYEYSLEFLRRYYRPGNAIIFVVGEFDRRQALELIRRHYGPWGGKPADPKVPAEPRQRGERRADLAWPTPTHPRLMVGYHTPGTSTRSRDAAIQNILGPLLFGPQSPLHRDLVLWRQLCESLDPLYFDHRDPNLFYFLATVKSPKDLAEVERTIDAAVEELRHGKLEPGQLRDVQSHLRYRLAMHLETPAQIAVALARHAAVTDDPRGLEKLLANLERVTVEDVVAFARRYLLKENRTVVTLEAGAPGPDAAPARGDRPATGGAR